MKTRHIVAGLAGIVVAFLVIAGVEMIKHGVYPPQTGLDFSNADQVRGYMEGMAPGQFAFVLAAWIGGAFVGALVAASIAKARPYLFAGIVGGVVLAATAANLVMIPHPLWFTALAVVAIPLAAFAAGFIAARKG